MLMWWFTALLSSGSGMQAVSRFMLPVIVTGLTTTAYIDAAPDGGATVTSSSNNTSVTSSSPPSSLIQGVYDYESSENFEAYLRELGVPYLLRVFAGLARPTVTISKNSCINKANDDCKEWKIHTSTLFKSHEVSFDLDEPTVDTTMDGRNVRMTVSQSAAANVWSEVQVGLDGNFRTDPDGKTTRLVRKFLPDKMTVHLTCGNVESSSVFKRRRNLG